MLMGDNELLREMRTAANPREQVGILADLNGVPHSEMEKHLEGLGFEIPKRRGRKPGPKPKKPVETVADSKPAPEPEVVTADEVVSVSDTLPMLLRIAIVNTIDQLIEDDYNANSIKEMVRGMLALLHKCEEVAAQ